MHLNTKNSKGFTLIELLIVVGIIAILAAIAIPTYMKYVDRAKLISSVATMDVIKHDLELYNNDNGRYPGIINFPAFTDGSGNLVLLSASVSAVNEKINAWNSYNLLAGNSYELIAEAKDSSNTVITLTPNSISY
ncbi:MAG: prepilin-type N-terminal cleavage/methylation domain-containing protein [Proteobacteria bacterium]|nr:prepilin-type N-terminal cleavage/methylation domain-containing protein [Pseudomonadota bacterium]